MTQEGKELLLKDLSARLPYKVIVDYGYSGFDVHNGNYEKRWSKCTLICSLLDVFMSQQDEKGEYLKPYLFPLSSITDEQEKELKSLMEVVNVPMWGDILAPTIEYYDWLNKNHFDYRGLIEKGLAIDATNLNIY